MAGLVCYMFYKNVFMSMGQFWFNFNNAWSGQKYYNEAAIQMFNLMYTSIPIIAFAAYDKDITTTAARMFPQDYGDCIRNRHFSSSKFWGWLITAFIESTIVSVLPLYILDQSDKFGVETSFWDAGTMTYTAVVIICNMKLLFIQTRWHWGNLVLIIGSMLLWLATSLLYSGLLIPLFYQVYGAMQELLSNPSYWGGWIIICTIILGKDVYFCALDRMFNYHNYHIIQEFEMEKDFANKEIAEANLRRAAATEAVSGNPHAAELSADPGNSISSRSPRAVGALDMDAL
jgi:magnesium-transporting ATPase (P-type)